MQIANARCYNHAVREAAARCPQCTQFFCHECITEHDNQVICADCYAAKTAPREKSAGVPWFGSALAFGTGFWFIWFCVYTCGRLLLTIPSSWHLE